MGAKRQPKKRPARKPAPLEEYRGKRDFRKSPEPPPRAGGRRGRIFVVQEHAARSHHFDLRLEIDGVLASWAVPKGVPEDYGSKRLAVHVEDHPVSYAGFSGRIPEGHYGAGTVEIWDHGEWEPLEKDWRKSYGEGKLKFILHGKRLEGPYLLARMEGEPNWLLRKLDPATHPAATPAPVEKEVPGFVAPQLSRPVAAVPQGKEWVHEIKLDGYRLIAVRREGKVQLFTRKQLDWTDRFPGVAARLGKLEGGDFVIDGEAVVFDGKGRSQFGLLQEALGNGGAADISFVAFDLLNAEGSNLRKLPWSERVARLAEWIPDEKGPLRRSKVWSAGEGADLFKQACRLGLEGIISKRRAAPYVPESRRDWVKSKCRPRQEFIICGFTEPRNSCPAFGALVLGSYEKGSLVPRGKVGTGFSAADRHRLLNRMKPLAAGRLESFPAEKAVTWLRPELIAEVEFAEITRDGAIRQGSFVGLREDKAPADVHLDPVEKASADDKDTKVAGVRISHPGRIVYPEDGIPKIEVARYYERVADWILPHVANRPLALLRAPDGIGAGMFFQKSFKGHVPPHVRMRTLADGSEVIHISSVKGLISLVQFGVIEIHPWGASLKNPEKPDRLVWDLDPHPSVPWEEILGTAFLLRDFLAERGLETQVKTSGGKGLHIVLHLRRKHGWEQMKPFAKAVASAVAEQNPLRLTTKASFAKRADKIYIDWLRNGRGATCIAPWALRARPGAPVSMPLDWTDLPGLARAGFSFRDPAHLPRDWKEIRPQEIPVSLLRELGGG